MRPSLESWLAEAQREPLARILLATADPMSLAAALSASDPWGEARALARASAIGGADPLRWLQHRLWCATRRAQGADRSPLDVVVDGTAHLAETAGRPTVLVAPLMLDTQDAVDVLQAMFPDRRHILFGEDVSPGDVVGDVEVPEPGHEARHVLEVLADGGVYCTYGDFVYQGRSTVDVDLLGTRRAMSRGWAAVAARDGTMLLPLAARRGDDGGLVADLAEPVEVRGRPRPEQVAPLLAALLQERVLRAPEQWLLLPTLTFEASQAAPPNAGPTQPVPQPAA
ncbi:hypothetical protein [Antribacter gilvus]|uniref:LpxL/LpxP family acyltransferase n=1 Tax=Antribacter gilvus TaxID=2304675 RepID=UPI000F784C56|nr:hypothetical protein [Antribacter gilvus]